jgi:hypothetical protein
MCVCGGGGTPRGRAQTGGQWPSQPAPGRTESRAAAALRTAAGEILTSQGEVGLGFLTIKPYVIGGHQSTQKVEQHKTT